MKGFKQRGDIFQHTFLKRSFWLSVEIDCKGGGREMSLDDIAIVQARDDIG